MINILVLLLPDPEPGARAKTSNTGSGQKIRLLAAQAPQHCLVLSCKKTSQVFTLKIFRSPNVNFNFYAHLNIVKVVLKCKFLLDLILTVSIGTSLNINIVSKNGRLLNFLYKTK